MYDTEWEHSPLFVCRYEPVSKGGKCKQLRQYSAQTMLNRMYISYSCMPKISLKVHWEEVFFSMYMFIFLFVPVNFKISECEFVLKYLNIFVKMKIPSCTIYSGIHIANSLSFRVWEQSSWKIHLLCQIQLKNTH